MQTGGYGSEKNKLLRDFDHTAQLLKGFVAERYGEETADTLYCDVRQEYEAIIPQIPRIRGARARILNGFLRITAEEVAVYKAMKKRGKTAPEAWEICHEAIRLRMKAFPRWKGRSSFGLETSRFDTSSVMGITSILAWTTWGAETWNSSRGWAHKSLPLTSACQTSH
jgi:hypothetical protein